MVFRCDPNETRAEQRPLLQVERHARPLARAAPGLRLTLLLSQVRHVVQGQVQLRRADPLHGRAVHEGERRAQWLVPADDFAQRGRQRGGVQRAVQAQRRADVVQRRAGLQPVDEPQPLLRERERRRVAFRAADDGKAHAGPTPRRLVHPRREVFQARRGKEGRERHLHPQPVAKPRHDARAQQRVAAQVEERVVHPHPLPPEQFGPHGGDGRFRGRTGCDEPFRRVVPRRRTGTDDRLRVDGSQALQRAVAAPANALARTAQARGGRERIGDRGGLRVRPDAHAQFAGDAGGDGLPVRIQHPDGRRKIGIRHVSPGVQIRALRIRQQRQGGDGRIRIPHEAAEQDGELRRHPLRGRAVEQVRRVAQLREQGAVRALRHRQRQVHLGLRALLRDGREAQAGGRLRRPVRRVLVDEHHLEHGRVAQAALGAQLLHELFERQVLVRERAQRRLAHAATAARGSPGRPDRSVRRASVLTNRPMSPSVSARVRPAMGVPTTTSASPEARARNDVRTPRAGP